MLKESLRQTGFLLKQKEAAAVTTILFALVIWNYLKNVVAFQGYDVARMYEPVKLLTLSYNRSYQDADITILLTTLYPFLVTLAAGLSCAKEQQTGERIFLISRLGKRRYMITKLLSVFLATVVVFTVPFFAELLMNLVSFPLSARGDMTNTKIYSPEYAEMVHNYLMSGLYIISPVLYTVLGILVFGICGGLLALFTTALSFLFHVRYRVFLFFPVFVLMNSTVYASETVFGGDYPVSWYEYLLLFNDNRKCVWYLPAAACFLLFLIVIFCFLAERRDQY